MCIDDCCELSEDLHSEVVVASREQCQDEDCNWKTFVSICDLMTICDLCESLVEPDPVLGASRLGAACILTSPIDVDMEKEMDNYMDVELECM